MELRDVLKTISKNIKTVTALTLLGAVLGYATYLLPAKYVATGSFYVRRSTEKSTNYFTYEGYYSQQTAITYTNTVTALLESTDIIQKALQKLDIQTTDKNLKYYKRQIDVKKMGPQLVSLNVKDPSDTVVHNLWQSLAVSLAETSVQVNSESDEYLSIVPISTEPVVRIAYKSLGLYIGTGIALGFLSGLFITSLFEYFREGIN